ncbi:MAG: hypothetical protein J0I84_09190, partial [Terrimonas sp.]|nr:hypothetical protein [Terrimonas sp.]
SLEKTMKYQKSEILNLKTEQISKEEINKTLASGTTEKKNQNTEKKAQETIGKKAYEVVSTQNESVIEKLSNEINNKYFIVLGAFKNLDNAKMFNKQQGHFQTVIKNSQLDSLRELIYKVNLFSLKDKYSAPITDQPTYTLKVQFDNGQQKTIEDYGNNGPDKLDKIYDLIFALRENQDWK